MIYVIGVSHQMQNDGDSNFQQLRKAFGVYVRNMALSIPVVLIAEENSLQAQGEYRCTLKELAHDLGIQHKYCDPDEEERLEVGIKRPYTNQREKHEADMKREKIWLSRIVNYKDSKTLFICGADHVTSFQLLLRENQWDVKVLNRHWDYDELVHRLIKKDSFLEDD